jgi:uncharacterized protein YndB with AHSA1/START domain
VSVVVTVVAPADPGAAWDRWSDVEAWPRWNPHCVSARADGPLQPGTRLELQLRHPRGRDFWTRPRVREVAPQRRLTWEATALGLSALTATALAPEPDGTRLTVRLTSSGPMAFAYRMTFTERAQAQLFTGVLDALSQSFK